jgi:NADPH-dependent curcumin reductase CurA
MAPVPIDAPMASFALAEVIESGSPSELAVGSLVVTVAQDWAEYSVQEILVFVGCTADSRARLQPLFRCAGVHGADSIL